MEKFLFILLCTLGFTIGVYLSKKYETSFEPTAQEVSCTKVCDPNQGMVNKNKCYCGNVWTKKEIK